VIVSVGVVSIIAAEVCFRWLGDRPSADMAGLFAPFGAGSYRLAPSVNTSEDLASGYVSCFTDELGLRCDSKRELATKAGDSIDVLFLGDSQGFGNGVNFEDTIAGAAAMAASVRGWRLANASVGGHSARNQLELARWLQDDQKISVGNYVLLFTPTMLINCDSYMRETVGQDGRLYDKPKNFLELLAISLKTNSVCYSRVRDAVRNSGIGNIPSASEQFIFGLYGGGPDERRINGTLKAFLGEFSAFAAIHGANVRIVYLPLTVEADFDPVRKAAGTQGISLNRDFPLRILQTVAAELKLPVENLRPELERLHAQGRQLNLKGDYHWDSYVSRTCGLALWSRIEPLLTKSQYPIETSDNPSNCDHGTK